MKKIQIITNNPSLIKNYDSEIEINNFNSLKTLDSYEINIFNLNCNGMWENKSTTDSKISTETKLSSDFRSINKMISNSTKSINIICLPQNLTYYWSCFSEKYSSQLKDMIPSFIKHLLQLIPMENLDIIYENSETLIGNNNIKSAFYINEDKYNILTKSNDSNKTTTIKNDRLIITTLNIINNSFEDLVSFIRSVGLDDENQELPEWVYEYKFNDDLEQTNNIEKAKEQIKIQKEIIESSNQKLRENLRFKSILYTNSSDLVDVVFEILEYIFEISLKDFNDKKREDFLFKKSDITFIGEIKGVTSNVKYEHISQLEVHYSKYLDELQEKGISEIIKKILIINYERLKDVNSRDEINDMQIQLANKNDTLIIDTKSLLNVYDKLINNKLDKIKVIDYIKNNSGLIDVKRII